MPIHTPVRRLATAIALTIATATPIAAQAAGYPILMEILAQVQAQIQELKTQGDQTRETVEQTSVDQQNNERELYNEQIKREQQPAPFCPDDQKITGSISRANSQAGYSNSRDSFNRYSTGKPSAIPADQRAAAHGGPVSVRNPVRYEKEKNDQLTAILESGKLKCDPRIAPPIGGIATGAGDQVVECNLDELEVFTRLVTGRKPIPQPPASVKETAAGQYLVSETDNYNARQSIIEQGIDNTTSNEVNTLLQAYQKLSESPSVKTINQMSATGGVERVKWFQQQIETQLQIQIYKEMMQNNRLQAVIAAQRQEEHFQRLNKIMGSLNSR